MLVIVLICKAFLSGQIHAFAAGFQKAAKKSIQPKAVEYLADKSTDRLVDHLMNVEECEGIESLDVGLAISTNIRGLFAKESFRPGDYICAIPFVSTLLLDETFFPTTEPNDELKLAAYRMENAVRLVEQIIRNESPLETLYRELLPMCSDDSNFSPTPDFWTVEEIKELEVPTIVQQLLERKEQVRSKVQCSGQGLNEGELRHALWLVRSRAFTTLKEAITLDRTEGLLQRTVMIPFLDLLNHRRTPNAALEVVESKAYEESFYALVAKKNISKGEEVTICYGTGDEASWELFTQYGFFPEGHETNDHQQHLEPTEWTTTLEDDIQELSQLSSTYVSVRHSILDFRIRMKKCEQYALSHV